MKAPLFFPILRAKAGEIEAIGRLSPLAKALTAPVLDMPPGRATDPDSILAQMAETLAAICTSWGTEHAFYLDFSRFEPKTFTASNEHLVIAAFNIARQLRLKAIPVTGSMAARGPSPEYLDAMLQLLETVPGILFRLDPEEFVTEEALAATLTALHDHLGIPPARADLYFDCQALEDGASDTSNQSLAEAVIAAQRFAGLRGYRRIILGGSSYPDPQSAHARKTTLRVASQEWRLWTQLITADPSAAVGFGTYGVVHPRQVDPSGRVRPPSRVRLVTESHYVIHKGPRANIRDVCHSAEEDPAFRDIGESWGRDEIRDCARGGGSKGNPTSWIARDTNAHVEHVARAVLGELESRGIVVEVDRSSIATPWLQKKL
jgi:hypothetical protein